MHLGDEDLLSQGVSFLTYLAKLSFISIRTNTAVTMTTKPRLTCGVTNTRIALVSPSSIYTGRQCEHWYEPKLLTHSRSAGKSCFPNRHSSTSSQNLRKKPKLKTLHYKTFLPTLWKWPCVSVYFSFCSSSYLSFSHPFSQDSSPVLLSFLYLSIARIIFWQL